MSYSGDDVSGLCGGGGGGIHRLGFLFCRRRQVGHNLSNITDAKHCQHSKTRIEQTAETRVERCKCRLTGWADKHVHTHTYRSHSTQSYRL